MFGSKILFDVYGAIYGLDGILLDLKRKNVDVAENSLVEFLGLPELPKMISKAMGEAKCLEQILVYARFHARVFGTYLVEYDAKFLLDWMNFYINAVAPLLK